MLVKHFFFSRQNKTNQSWESRSLVLNRVAKRTLFIVNRVRAPGGLLYERGGDARRKF